MNTKNNTLRRLLPLAAALTSALAPPAAWSQAAPAPAASLQAREWAPARLIVMQRAGLPASEMDKALKPHGGKARRLGRSDIHVIDLPRGASETRVLEQLRRHPHFKWVELDYKAPRALSANDPMAGSQWHLGVTRTPPAWDAVTGAGVTIAVLDGGILATHPDLQANLLPGYNAWDGSSTTTDINNHGTAVAGVAAAVLNNGTGVSGVAGGARIKPVRITDYSGTAWYSTIAQGIIHAADQGIRVVNCSYGWLFRNASVQSAAEYLKGKGGVLVVSAGNNGTDEQSAATSSMVVVSATDASDQLASWSSYGQMVTVSAPGVGIVTTASDGGYESASGTSFASPLVAGVVALMISANPSLTPNQLQGLLTSTATDLGPAGRDIYFGAGRVNAEAAVAAARSATAADTTRPNVAIASPAGGSTVSGLVAVDVNATDNVGVARVELRANGALVATDSVAPYQFSWDSSTAAAGSTVTLTAVAVDAAGNSQTSAGVSVSLAGSTPPVAPDTTPPAVSIANPANNSTVSGSVAISARATDNLGTTGLRLQLHINNVLRQSSTGGSLSFNWNTKKERAGSHTISVTATDAAGNRSVSSVQVTRR